LADLELADMNRDQIIKAMARGMCCPEGRCDRVTCDVIIPQVEDAAGALSALEYAGLAVVPREPTQEMVDAALMATRDDLQPTPDEMREFYAAMLNASPFKETTNAG
jgi:hypothetical protein